jgi:hypothetical protein
MINDNILLLIIINFDSKLQGSYCMPKVTNHQNIANTQIPSNSSEIPSELPYACPKKGCNSKFRWKSWLYRHVSQVHQKIRPYACQHPQCLRAFSTLNSLEGHTKIEHENNKGFSCTTCKKGFYTEVALCLHYAGYSHKKVESENKHLGVKASQTIIDGISKKLEINDTSLTVGATTSNVNKATQTDQTQESYESQDSIDILSKKRKLDNSSLTIVDNTSNVNETTQADQTQEIYASQDILDLSIKKRKLDNSSLTVENASSNTDNENADSSTTLAEGICIEALRYMCLVDTKETNPNFFEDYFWDRATGNLVEKDPAFVE